MHGLFQDSRDFLRERSMLGGRAATERFLQVIGNVCAYENSFAISHLSSPLSADRRDINPANAEQVCKPNSVLRLIEAAIIHLVQPLPAGSSDLPGGRSGWRSASGGQPF